MLAKAVLDLRVCSCCAVKFDKNMHILEYIVCSKLDFVYKLLKGSDKQTNKQVSYDASLIDLTYH
jgi:hypothetical protein